jgi:DNA-binding SARP family transcriptional activator/tetratricopeptide (TPR) repeat protein
MGVGRCDEGPARDRSLAGMRMSAPQIRLRTFGTLAVEGTSDEAAATLLNGPKRMALLIHLASAPAGTFVRRDSLLPLFWPEQDQPGARHALRNTLYEIRKSLGSHLIRSRGKEEVGLTVGALELDALVFDRAISEGRMEEVTALYRGPFLEGFHVPDAAPELEHWIDSERNRRERSYRFALEQIAESHGAAGAPWQAAEIWRVLVDRDPIRERLVVRLMESLVRAGDRGGALRAATVYIDHMRDEFDAEPAPRVAALLDDLRSHDPAATVESSPAATPVFEDSQRADRHELVGREGEWGELLTAWRAADAGRAGFAVIAGVAGVGKTRLAQELISWTERRGASVAVGRCYDSDGRLAYGPIAECLRAGRIRGSVDRLEPAWRTEIARLLPELLAEDADLARPEPLAEAWKRLSFFSALVRGVRSAGEPVLLFIDDLQWADSGTLDWLRFLMHDALRARLLVVGTVRIEEPGEDHLWHDQRLALLQTGQLTEIPLRALSPGPAAALAAQVAGRALSSNESEVLFAETEGNPLFIVEAVRSGLLDGSGGPGSAASHSVARRERESASGLTPRVKAVIQRRIDALSPAGRSLASLASVIGQPFSPDLAAAASRRTPGDEELAAALDELHQRRILETRTDGTLAFTHDKLREVAYAETGEGRRRLLHNRVADALALSTGTERDAVLGRLGVHLERAGRLEESIRALENAADLARAAHANGEVIHLLERALTVLTRTPARPGRDARERRLQLALGVAGVAVDGWSNERSHLAFQRYLALAEEDLTSDTVTAWWGLQAFPGVRGEIRRTVEVATSLLERAEHAGNAEAIRVCRFNEAFARFFMGEMPRARNLLEQIAADPEYRDHRLYGVSFPLGVFTLSYLGHVHWHLGNEALADRFTADALAVASEERGGGPFERAVALVYEALLAVYAEDPDRAVAAAETAIELCDRANVRYYAAVSRVVHGWAVGTSTDPADGLAEMRRGLDAIRSTGSDIRRPWFLGLMARLEGRVGRIGAGRKLVAEALELGRSRGEVWSEPELLRIDAELLARRGAHPEAERVLRRSAQLAREQGSVAVATNAELGLRALEAQERAG